MRGKYFHLKQIPVPPPGSVILPCRDVTTHTRTVINVDPTPPHMVRYTLETPGEPISRSLWRLHRMFNRCRVKCRCPKEKL